jgi:tetratricopeptide (TPR) repeat protein
VVQDLRGVGAALATVESALRQVPHGIGAFQALINLVVQASLTAEDTLDLVAGSDDPDVIASTSSVLASAFVFVERGDDARAVLRRAIDRLRSGGDGAAPSREVDLLLWLSELDQTDDRAEARTSLERALTLARDHPDLRDRVPSVQTRLGLVLSEAHSWERAVEILSAVEPPEEDRAHVERVLAVGRVITGEYSQGIDALNRLVADGSDPWPLYFLALAESKTGQYQAALDSVAQGISLAGPVPELLLLCAGICSDIAEYEAAIRYAEAALEVKPDNPSAYQTMAWALQHLGPTRGAECEAAFQRVIDLTNESNERLYALKGRAGARRALGREAEARADYEQVLEQLEPGSDPWLEGWVRYNLGEYDAAASAFELALANDADRVAAQFDLALCQAVAGGPGAVEAYRAALARLDEREPRGRLAPLRVARNDLRDAELVHGELETEQTFQIIVAEVEDSLERTEALVVRPIFPSIPPTDPEEAS